MSTPKTIFIPLPLTAAPDDIKSHPAIKWYIQYGSKFPRTTEAWDKFPPSDYEQFYASNHRTILPDRRIIKGGDASFRFFRELYSTCQVTREMLSLILVEKSEEVWDLYFEVITTLDGIDVPQSFVYTLGKSEDGKGMEGMQFRELKCYYDVGLVEKALGEKIDFREFGVE